MSVLFAVWKILIVNLTVIIAVYKVRNINIRNWMLKSSYYVPATPATRLNITEQYSIIEKKIFCQLIHRYTTVNKGI